MYSNDNYCPVLEQVRKYFAARAHRKLSKQMKAFLQEKFK